MHAHTKFGSPGLMAISFTLKCVLDTVAAISQRINFYKRYECIHLGSKNKYAVDPAFVIDK